MTVFIGKPSKYWYAYSKPDRKVLGKAVKLKTLWKKFGSTVIYGKGLYKFQKFRGKQKGG